jgi:two-component system NtrC family sensor kinase
MQLNQVFMNMLVNAAQALPKRGNITLSSGLDGAQVWIAIADDGEGIPESILQRIFDPFFTTKPVGKARVWAYPCPTASSRSTMAGST